MRPRFLLLAGACFGLSLLASVLAEKPQPPRDAGAKIGGLPGIVFVGAPIFDEKTDGGQGVYQGAYHWRDSYIYPRSSTYHRAERTMGPTRPGRNLYSLVPARPDGKLTRLTHLKEGAVFKPEPSFDGKKVLFAMRRDGEDWFHQYEVNVDGTGLRQLTDGPFNDFGGVYLPDGRIVFCSDRTGYLEEYHEERTETLFTMNGNGTNMQQITFLPGTYFEPSILQDGRILFAFWDPFHIDVPPFDKHETYLATVNPDGTEERHLFGVGQYQFFNRERHSGVGLTQAHEMPDGRLLCQSEFGPSLVDLRAGLAMRDALIPIFPGTTSIQLGGTTHKVHLSPLGTRSTPFPLADGRFLFSATLPGARDSGLFVGNPDTREEQQVLNIPNYAEFDPVPVLVERKRPALLPTRAKPPAATGQTTRFLVVAGHNADNPQRAEAMKKARFLRVIEAEYTCVTTSSHTNLETRILGTVPLLPDGSAYFEAPADTPLFLDPLDAGGNRILMEWNYPSTSVAEGLPYPATQIAYMSGRAGETRGCYGCHAPQTEAVPNVSVLALKNSPVQVTREPTDLQYRRNDPEGYRRQARIGDTDLLGHCSLRGRKECVLRDCETLMYLEDGAASRMEDLVKLLKSRDIEVRRAAALALTRLATWKEAAALKAALEDPDWQVRHAVEAALEALGQAPAKKGATTVSVFEILGRQEPTAAVLAQVRAELSKETPDVLALRAAGKLRDPEAVPLLVPWLRKHEWEYHAAEAAVALGRIGTSEAVAALWDALRSEVPIRKVHISRYLQHGPRPEEYALLRGLYLAGANPKVEDVHLLIALLPNTFTEKPRFEDRMREESQRVLLPRALLRKAKLTQPLVAILIDALNGRQKNKEPLYDQLLKGINLERPFSEHGRPFPVVKEIGAEEALWLLGCLFNTEGPPADTPVYPIPEERVVALLKSPNHRERIDAAVLLGRIGISQKAADALAAEIAKPYAFPEIWSIGKGMPDTNFRDKAYMMLTLAKHTRDVNSLRRFADPLKMTRDIRYALARGLASRWDDALPLLAEMATRDPITLIRQQARYAIEDIQFRYPLGGNKPPLVQWPEPLPLEALYPPRGLQWEDTTFTEFNRELPPAAETGDMDRLLIPVHFRNLNNAQAKGAQLMMIDRIEETRRAFDRLDRKDLEAALEKPYPFTRYLAARALAERGGPEAIPVLLRKAEEYHKAQDTVGFWWCCEALGRLRAKDAVPLLSRWTVLAPTPNVFGPEGLPVGYIAAKNLAQISADPKQEDVARLLKSDNIWLRAGTLRGLAEAGAPGIDKLLQQASAPEEPAVVRHEAEVQLRRIKR